MAFYNSIMHEIIRLDLIDQEFIASRTSNYEELARTVADYPPERAATITGVDADLIREVAKTWGEAKAASRLLGHGHLPAHDGHRQRPLPDRPVLDHRQRRPAWHRAAPACAARTTCRGRRTPA